MQAAVLQKTSLEMVERFQDTLFNLCNFRGKRMVDRYMKQMVVARGIPYNNQMYIFERFWTPEVASSIANDEKKLVAEKFIHSKYAEDKIVGMKIINSFNKEIDNAYVDALKKYYTEGHIKGWAMSDKFSLTVLNPWGKLSQSNAEYLSNWRTDKNEWVRRSSCISFFQRARYGDKNQMNFNGFMDLMYKIANHVVKQEERYNQMAVGQLLREMTLARGFKQKTIDFIKERKASFNDESIRIAISKLKTDTKKSILNLGKSFEELETKKELTYYEKMAKKKQYIEMQKERKMYIQIKQYLGIAKKDR